LTATEERSARYIHCRIGLGCKSLFGQLRREKSLIAKRCEMKGNSGHTSKANFGTDICDSNPPAPASQCGLCDATSERVRTADIPALSMHRYFFIARRTATELRRLLGRAETVEPRHQRCLQACRNR
jgi:hypothetical protein